MIKFMENVMIYFMGLFPIIAGIILGYLNIGILNKEYSFLEWMILSSALIFVVFLIYSII